MSTNPGNVGLPTSGGTVNNWVVISQEKGTQVLANGRIRDVEIIGVRTVPHDVRFLIQVPYETWRLNGGDIIAQPIATGIEVILDIPAADDAWYIEDTNNQGLVVGFIVFLVSIPFDPLTADGPMSTQIEVPVSRAADYTYVQGLCNAAKAELSAAAAK